MRLTIYQIDPELDQNLLVFRDIDIVQRISGGRIPAEIYKAVYEGELNISSLEDAFYIFNVQHPAGYKGRSMSVSDVIELSEPGKSPTYHFCCSVGFRQIEFDKKKAVPLGREVRDTDTDPRKDGAL